MMEACQNVTHYFWQNRLYLPESLCVSMENFECTLHNEVYKIESLGSLLPMSPYIDLLKGKRLTVFTDAFQVIAQEIPRAKKALENEFRALLGGSSSLVSVASTCSTPSHGRSRGSI